LKIGSLDRQATSAQNYHYMLRNTPEERGSLKSRIARDVSVLTDNVTARTACEGVYLIKVWWSSATDDDDDDDDDCDSGGSDDDK
jgi:hypothetical protein